MHRASGPRCIVFETVPLGLAHESDVIHVCVGIGCYRYMFRETGLGDRNFDEGYRPRLQLYQSLPYTNRR